MIADSSFLIALFNKDDEQHRKAAELFEKMPDYGIVVPEQMLEECFTVFAYKIGIEFSLEFIGKIKINRKFVACKLAHDEWNDVVKIAAGMRKNISFADYVAIYLSKKTGESILTFDKQLAKAAR